MHSGETNPSLLTHPLINDSPLTLLYPLCTLPQASDRSGGRAGGHSKQGPQVSVVESHDA